MKTLILILFLFSCGKDSNDCWEGCDEDPTDRALITEYDIFIDDNSQVKFIYPQYTSKYHPATFLIFDSITIDTTKSSTYKGVYDIRNFWLAGERYEKGDVFVVRYEIRYKYIPAQWADSITLIY